MTRKCTVTVFGAFLDNHVRCRKRKGGIVTSPLAVCVYQIMISKIHLKLTKEQKNIYGNQTPLLFRADMSYIVVWFLFCTVGKTRSIHRMTRV